MTHHIVVALGEGIGPEVVGATVEVLNALELGLVFEYVTIGTRAVARSGNPLPREALEAMRRANAVLKGPTATEVGGGLRSTNVALREALNTYACVRPVRTLPGVRAPIAEAVDLVIVRENLEDVYQGIEAAPGTFFDRFRNWNIPRDAAVGLKIISRTNTLRICRFAFLYAVNYDRKRVTCVHKATIMKETDGFFLRCFQEVASEFPEITSDDILVDNAAAQLILHPERFDVIVTENLYGDILSDEAAALVGGLGVAAGANIGDRYAVFEATHGTAPDIAEQNRANPTATMFSAVMMLDHLGETDAARRLQQAVEDVLREGTHVTADLHPATSLPVGTREMAEAIIAKLSR